jgi:hypothetical protein
MKERVFDASGTVLAPDQALMLSTRITRVGRLGTPTQSGVANGDSCCNRHNQLEKVTVTVWSNDDYEWG